MRSPVVQLLTDRRFAPLFVTQFLGAFDDDLLKSAVRAAANRSGAEGPHSRNRQD